MSSRQHPFAPTAWLFRDGATTPCRPPALPAPAARDEPAPGNWDVQGKREEGQPAGSPFATVPYRVGPAPQPTQLQTPPTNCWGGPRGAASRPHQCLPGGRCHDAATLLRGGLHAAARAVVAHAEIVADFVGHRGGCSDGLLRVVLHRDGGDGSAQQPGATGRGDPAGGQGVWVMEEPQLPWDCSWIPWEGQREGWRRTQGRSGVWSPKSPAWNCW